MNKFLYKILFILPLAYGLDSLAVSLADKTMTITDQTGKALRIKSQNKIVTLKPGESKIFKFESLKDAEVGYEGSLAPYRPLGGLSGSAIASIALNLQRTNAKNVNVDLVPGTLWAAKIANINYSSPTKGAVQAYAPAR